MREWAIGLHRGKPHSALYFFSIGNGRTVEASGRVGMKRRLVGHTKGNAAMDRCVVGTVVKPSLTDLPRGGNERAPSYDVEGKQNDWLRAGKRIPGGSNLGGGRQAISREAHLARTEAEVPTTPGKGRMTVWHKASW